MDLGWRVVTSVAEVRLWGRTIGAVAIEEGADVADFEKAEQAYRHAIEIQPDGRAYS